MSKNFRVTLNERLKDENFKSEYDALESEYQLINAILDCRKEMKKTIALCIPAGFSYIH